MGAHLESEADRNAILTHLTSGLLTALLSSSPGYPRHRWTRCDLATDDLGIIGACHSHLSTTYRRFVHRTLDTRSLPGEVGVTGLHDDDEGLQALAEAAPVVGEIAEAGLGAGAAGKRRGRRGRRKPSCGLRSRRSARARAQAKAKVSVLGCATFAIV